MPAQERFDLVIRARDEATGVLNQVDRSVQKLATTTAPNLSRALDSTGGAFGRAELKAALLTGRLAGLPPAITQVTSAFYLLSPQIAIIAAGVALLTSEYRYNKAQTEALTAAVKLNAAALGELALRHDAVGEAARRRFGTEKKELELQVASLEAAYASFTNVEAAKKAYISEFGSDEEAMKGWARAQAGMTLRAREMEDQIKALKDQLASLNKPYEEQIALSKKDADLIDRIIASRQKLLLLLKPEEFRGRGFDQSLRGPDFFGTPKDEQEKAREEADRAMESLIALSEDQERAIADAQEQWQEFRGLILSSTDQLSAGITDLFFGLRDSLADVFRDMARAWVRYFINEIIKQTALRLGFALFNVIFPGSGGLAGLAGATGAGDVPVIPGLSRISPNQGTRTGIDVISAGARRFPASNASSASINVNIQGDIIGTDEFVGKRIIPAIENAIRYQKTSIAGR